MPFFDHLVNTCFADHSQTQHSFFPDKLGNDVVHAVKQPGLDILCTSTVGTTVGEPSDQIVTWQGSIENPKDTVDGLKIGWSHPPQDIKISVNKVSSGKWEDVTNWLPAPRSDPADKNLVVQNVILRHPQQAKGIRVHMRDARKEGMFGIKQIALVGHTLLS